MTQTFTTKGHRTAFNNNLYILSMQTDKTVNLRSVREPNLIGNHFEAIKRIACVLRQETPYTRFHENSHQSFCVWQTLISNINFVWLLRLVNVKWFVESVHLSWLEHCIRLHSFFYSNWYNAATMYKSIDKVNSEFKSYFHFIFLPNLKVFKGNYADRMIPISGCTTLFSQIRKRQNYRKSTTTNHNFFLNTMTLKHKPMNVYVEISIF